MGTSGGHGTAGPQQQCIETFYEDLRRKSLEMTNDDPPLCFAISTIFRDSIGERLGEASEPICMYRCEIDDDCNFYLEFDEEDL